MQVSQKITISAVLKNTTTSMFKMHYQLYYMDGSTTESSSWIREHIWLICGRSLFQLTDLNVTNARRQMEHHFTSVMIST
jgi:uncharacterized protein YcfL